MLTDKIQKALEVIKEAYLTFKRITVAWTGGKDSTLALWLVRKIEPKPLVLFIDEGDHFEEIWDFVLKVQKEWDLDLIVGVSPLLGKYKVGDIVPVEDLKLTPEERNKLGIKQPFIKLDPDSPIGTYLLKAKVLESIIEDYKLDAIITGIRRDEHPSRAYETYFSKRQTHTRVHPILDFTEEDVWNTIICNGIPYCSLYEHGYRSIGSKSSTKKLLDIPAWEQDLSEPERAGRAQDKELMMQKLREMGYM